MTATRVLFLVLCAAATAPVLAQGRTVRPLAPPTWVAIEEYSLIDGVAELPSGEVVVVDRTEKRITVLSPDGRRARSLGRTGDGPLEFRFVAGAVRGRGDTVFVTDPARRQLLVIDPRGALVSTRPFVANGPVRGLDASGRRYSERIGIERTGDEVKRSAWYEVVVATPAGTTQVAVKLRDRGEAPAARRFHPLPERDAWAVEPDGSLLVLRAVPYRLERWRHGQLVATGPAIPHQPVSVTATDRDEDRLRRSRQPAAGVRMANTDGSPAAPGGGARRISDRIAEMFPDESYPASHPPFASEAPIHQAPDGTLWVFRGATERRPTAEVDRLGADGSYLGTFTLSAAS
jgi:hypothetical protein